jgi:DNA-binding NtrC family response regulator
VGLRDFSEDALTLLRQYSWPGNVCELRNAVKWGIGMARGNLLTPNHLPASIHRAGQPPAVQTDRRSATATRTDRLEDAEREYLVSLLEKNSGNVSQICSSSWNVTTRIAQTLKKHGVDARDYRP